LLPWLRCLRTFLFFSIIEITDTVNEGVGYFQNSMTWNRTKDVVDAARAKDAVFPG
jgi:hypothetical protein